ncbi:MAG: hypothetical protein OMM_03947 [Candidatus Magnetoglobus multicellularis str. Araruama]|uniref:Alanine--tRNA ligase n=1 Tax=Candidatus Magnetoglobus multicellularis str. Araruama TaxID=890399 RepID=A0A1V1P3W8_9BACT|nr:MAG: hypothetical protein OMM_03947 [Candidatus Magnetoglobus multicellularis str. Araruama]
MEKKENQYALIQNCFRYFDMGIIGKSPIHLSYFQMPGAFSFKPLPKKECIFQLYDLLTNKYHFLAKNLWATYFNGDTIGKKKLPADKETFQAWIDVGIPKQNIIGLDSKHNFWKQSPHNAGKKYAPKCGAHTEIFYDRGENLKCRAHCFPGCNCGRFIEVTNTLFITYHIDDKTGYVQPLDKPFTETVIGLERVAMLQQNVSSVFEIDSLHPLICYIRSVSQKKLLITDNTFSVNERVIADHIRAILLLTFDGAPSPGKGGRARLMRKLIRETLTSLKLMNINDSKLINSIVEFAINFYSSFHPQLLRIQTRVLDYINEEKERFDLTLEKGYRRINRIVTNKLDKIISGEDIVKLEKQYGIPYCIVKHQLQKNDIKFSEYAYRKSLEQWKQINC